MCKYDYVDSGLIKPLSMTDTYAQQVSQTETSTATTATTSTTQQVNLEASLTTNFRNFQILFTSMMTVPKIQIQSVSF